MDAERYGKESNEILIYLREKLETLLSSPLVNHKKKKKKYIYIYLNIFNY